MSTKLTLTLDKSVIEKTKSYARERNTSLSRLVENYFIRVAFEEGNPGTPASLPPITSRLTGLGTTKRSLSDKPDKDLLLEALEEKYLS